LLYTGFRNLHFSGRVFLLHHSDASPFQMRRFGALVQVPPSSFVSAFSFSCPSLSSYDKNIVTLFSVLSYNTWKISASSALLRETRDVDAIISTTTKPSGNLEQTKIRTSRISMTYFDTYAWIIFIHTPACLLSDVITSGNRELLFRSHNTTNLRRGQHMRFRVFRPAGDV
jgi:hypothetical protein